MFEVHKQHCTIGLWRWLTYFIGKDIPIVHRVVRSYTEEDKKVKAKNKKAGYVFLLRAASLLHYDTNQYLIAAFPPSLPKNYSQKETTTLPTTQNYTPEDRIS